MLKELTIPQFKKQLAAMDKKEVDALLLLLYKLSKTGKQIVNMELQGEEYIKQVAESYKTKIWNLFFPTNLTTHFHLSEIKAVSKEFIGICSDEAVVADFRLYMVECMLEFTNTFGDIDRRFYDFMCKIFHDAIVQVKKHPNFLAPIMDERFQNCISSASGFGWGVEYYMRQEYQSMLEIVSKNKN